MPAVAQTGDLARDFSESAAGIQLGIRVIFHPPTGGIVLSITIWQCLPRGTKACTLIPKHIAVEHRRTSPEAEAMRHTRDEVIGRTIREFDLLDALVANLTADQVVELLMRSPHQRLTLHLGDDRLLDRRDHGHRR